MFPYLHRPFIFFFVYVPFGQSAARRFHVGEIGTLSMFGQFCFWWKRGNRDRLRVFEAKRLKHWECRYFLYFWGCDENIGANDMVIFRTHFQWCSDVSSHKMSKSHQHPAGLLQEELEDASNYPPETAQTYPQKKERKKSSWWVASERHRKSGWNRKKSHEPFGFSWF